VPSDVDEMSGRRSRRQIPSSRKPLVRGTCERGNTDQATQTDENPYRPTPHVDIACRDRQRFTPRPPQL
jgi:hypothetical protein